MFGSINFLDLELLKYSFEYHIPNYSMSARHLWGHLHFIFKKITEVPENGSDDFIVMTHPIRYTNKIHQYIIQQHDTNLIHDANIPHVHTILHNTITQYNIRFHCGYYVACVY